MRQQQQQNPTGALWRRRHGEQEQQRANAVDKGMIWREKEKKRNEEDEYDGGSHVQMTEKMENVMAVAQF
jgi:hypothetical protein